MQSFQNKFTTDMYVGNAKNMYKKFNKFALFSVPVLLASTGNLKNPTYCSNLKVRQAIVILMVAHSVLSKR